MAVQKVGYYLSRDQEQYVLTITISDHAVFISILIEETLFVKVNKILNCARWPVFLQLGVAQLVEQIILASVRQKSLGVVLRAVCIPYSAEAFGGSPNLSQGSGARTTLPAE
jgi:hypothetical protein